MNCESDLYKTDLTELGLSNPTLYPLMRSGITSIDILEKKTSSDLRKIRGIGKLRICEIKIKLNGVGKSLKEV